MLRKIIPAAAAAAIVMIGGSACAMTPGDVVGTVYTTDILTTLDEIPIPSYNIDGYTVIAVKDLRDYGFTVTFDEEAKRVDVTTGDKPEGGSYQTVERGTVGGTCGNVLYTDIVAYVNGVSIPSYNVDGYTCVIVEDLGTLTDDYNKEVGWSDYNFRHSYDDSTRTLSLYAFRFDKTYGDAVNEASELASANEAELYTKGTTAPYFGARVEPEKGVYAGINADVTDGFTNTFAVYSSYFTYDMHQTEFEKESTDTFRDKDAINLIPWNTLDVSQVWGDEDYIRKTLDSLKAEGKKTIIRYAGEMNVGTLGDSPTAYVKAFRHVADIVHEYDDFAIMWSPNDFGSFNRPYELYYPGDDYVDWVGISCFMKHDFLGRTDITDEVNMTYGCGDYAWTPISLKKITKFMEENNIEKPVAISEGGVESSVTYDVPDLYEWGYPRLRAMYWYTAMKFPQVKMVTYFNQNSGGEMWGFKVTDEYRDIITDCIEKAGYLTSASQQPDFTFVKADSVSYSDTLPLYTYAYFPHDNISKVEYIIDGTTFAQSTQIPYEANIAISGLSDGIHSLKLKITSDKSEYVYDYTLTKSSGVCKLAAQ